MKNICKIIVKNITKSLESTAQTNTDSEEWSVVGYAPVEHHDLIICNTWSKVLRWSFTSVSRGLLGLCKSLLQGGLWDTVNQTLEYIKDKVSSSLGFAVS